MGRIFSPAAEASAAGAAGVIEQLGACRAAGLHVRGVVAGHDRRAVVRVAREALASYYGVALLAAVLAAAAGGGEGHNGGERKGKN